MYLKRLDIQGFKSFADKICLEFDSGITSVVGPNGSGKSNIADSIRWVLGEQSAKTLRGSKMEDVIFTGTEHRKPMGFAEVSLTIDNSDSVLPVEYSEVTVTRRVYRSGESEYFINKTLCRLKDITELFLDTGIGKDGYSIIGQGRIDEILSNRSEDRRQIFEEASGIMKYKTRKAEAEKKLELTRQNLLRINDIMLELENQLEPLKQQSEVAKKYLNLRERLKELEVNVFIDRISKFKNKISELDEKYSSIKESIESENRRLEEMHIRNKSKSNTLKALEEKLNNSKQEFYDLENRLEKCSSEKKLNDERICNLTNNIERIDEEITDIKNRITGHNDEMDKRKKKLVYLYEQHSHYSKELSEFEKQMEEILSSLNEEERHIESLKNSIMDKLDILSDKKIQINNLKTHIDGIVKRQSSINNEVFQLSLELDRERLKMEELGEGIKRAKDYLSKCNSRVKSLQDKKKDYSIKLENEKKLQNKIKSDYQYYFSRYKMLCEMEENFEGYNRSVKSLLMVCNQSPEFGSGIYGALAGIIEVDKEYETAIEMALGGALQNIVTRNENDAKRAIDFLKKNSLGRATFLPVSSVKMRNLEGSIVNMVKNCPGFCGIASELVKCNAEYKNIISNLLGRVVVVSNLDDAINMARSFKYSFRIVTLDGEILNTSGAMTGGSAEKNVVGILNRNREIKELKDKILHLKEDEKRVEKDAFQTIQEIKAVEEEIIKLENDIKNSQLLMIKDESLLGQLEKSINNTTARIEMLKEEQKQLKKQQLEDQEEMGKYAAELETVENDISETKRIVEKHQESHKERQSEREQLHAEITDYKISVNSILESIQSVKDTIQRVSGEKDNLLNSINRKTKERERYINEIDSLKKKNEGLLNRVKIHKQEKAGKTFEIDRITEEKGVVEEELNETTELISEINKNILLIQEDYNRIEVRRTKVEADMEAVQNRMWDEYELTYTNALEYKKDIGSISQAQKNINDLKNEIKELGPVNVAAIEDYIKTKERHEFIKIQKEDMVKAEQKLQRVIGEMTSIMKRRFLEQFKLINHNFNIVFQELFEGGRAGLVLVDENNILETGIEVNAQPPGKKLQNMMLLSGGERSLTAIALLFAILRLKPTPFCVLDEIEAALDDANVYRFSQYLKRFSHKTQFILITHKKVTMENSDTLYGVTMEERGISKIISMKMDDSKAG
ncbi:MAG: chromosome segregation protein SMC [Acetivibrionales bacterium]